MGAKHSRVRRTKSAPRAYDSRSAPPSEGRRMARSSTVAFQRKYGFIPDNFASIAQVQEKLRDVGLESSNLILGVDFTKSNEWTGRRSFEGRCLHALGPRPNPYEEAISIIGQALSPFDEDNLIPCYGFGDVSTHDTDVFSFNPDDRPCDGFGEALERYRSIAPKVRLSGPTSFAPIIRAAMRTVEQSGGHYHVLVIVADGQVTRTEGMPAHELSEQEQQTVEAIGEASEYPLSIVLVGVGDGPWETMQAFDDILPRRNFDNFQFVNLTKIMSTAGTDEQRAAKFALMALMEVPFQYKACAELNIIGKRTGCMPPRPPLGPPPAVREADAREEASRQIREAMTVDGSRAATDARECPVCLSCPKDTAFQCGHQVCDGCANKVAECPICRKPVAMRIKLYA